MKRRVPTKAWDATTGALALAIVVGPMLLIGTGIFLIFGIRTASEFVARRFE